MKMEEVTQQAAESDQLNFDAHEFDGLRDEFAGVAETWLKRADQFIRENPWLCIAVAAGVGCAVAVALRSGHNEDEEEPA